MEKLEIIPLGGIGEFGMNCMGIRFRDEMIVVDAGMGFPEETPYGVDISIPDFEYLDEYRDDITALFLTHGHEDHIGSTPYFLKKFNVPVYGSGLTLAFVEEKLNEHGILDDVLMHRVEAGDVAEVNSFEVEFIHASHSLVDCFSLAITSPAGTVIHTGDYKIDDTPVIGKPYDLKSLGRIGDEGVLALLADSTNATVPGRTPSEQAVIPDLEDIIANAEGRVFVTTFSSSIHRLQLVFDIAHSLDKKVCLLGRSMMRNVEITSELGLLNIPHDTEVDLKDARQMNDEDIVYLVTGSQGEQRAAMWNIATQSYKGLSIQQGDTVILSARIIPGNEKKISKMIGAIYRHGGNIIEEKRRLIHVSGHPSQEDIRIMTETVKPKYLVPIHGEYRMLFRHQEFAKNHLGFADENVVLIENGDVLELSDGSARVTERRDIHKVFIDGTRDGEVEYDTVRERRKLAFSGVVSLVVMLDKETKELLNEPDISLRGVTRVNPLNGTLQSARDSISEAIEAMTFKDLSDKTWLTENLRVHLKRFIQKETGTRPVIVPTIVEV
ncbi:MAG: ribonuclease J [Pyrinomonadaceae bacterium]|nr:ribonuclease J [Pyrinomonadaceae bacterium]